MTTPHTFRQAAAEDMPFLEQMSYEAGFPDRMDDRPSFEAAQNIEWVRIYTQGWTLRDDDYGLIVENEIGTPVGAAWYRDYSAYNVDTSAPSHELTIALLPEARGQKIGKALLGKLLQGASENDIAEICLYVRKNNERAKHMYQNMGFLILAEPDEDYLLMARSTALEAATVEG